MVVVIKAVPVTMMGLCSFTAEITLSTGTSAPRLITSKPLAFEESIYDDLPDVMNIAFDRVSHHLGLPFQGLAHGLFTFVNPDVHGVGGRMTCGRKYTPSSHRRLTSCMPAMSALMTSRGKYAFQHVSYGPKNPISVPIDDKLGDFLEGRIGGNCLG